MRFQIALETVFFKSTLQLSFEHRSSDLEVVCPPVPLPFPEVVFLDHDLTAPGTINYDLHPSIPLKNTYSMIFGKFVLGGNGARSRLQRCRFQ